MIDRFNSFLRKVPNWALYIMSAGWAGWLLYLALSGGLGVEPVKALEHRLGELGLQFLILGLAVTPLRRHLGLNLMPLRRAIGLSAFFFITLHVLVWLVLDVQILSQIWADILKRPYITVGMAAFVLLLPLAMTSNNRAVRKMGSSWRQLHKLTYPAVLLGGVHYLMLVKGWQIEPLLYLAAILGLLALRWRPKGRILRVSS